VRTLRKRARRENGRSPEHPDWVLPEIQTSAHAQKGSEREPLMGENGEAQNGTTGTQNGGGSAVRAQNTLTRQREHKNGMGNGTQSKRTTTSANQTPKQRAYWERKRFRQTEHAEWEPDHTDALLMSWSAPRTSVATDPERKKKTHSRRECEETEVVALERALRLGGCTLSMDSRDT
jgi:hypothetical protein